MQILLADAKIMNRKSLFQFLSTPMFQTIADAIVREMAQKDIEEIAAVLGCNHKIASENWLRFQDFFISEKMPAIMAYNGQAYKHLKAGSLSREGLSFAQKHLWITSFFYGLLRPLDGISAYRMEHKVCLEASDNIPLNHFWRNKLTDVLIKSAMEDDGIILHLSTEEYENLFDWKRINKELKVIQPLFYVRNKGELKIQAIWAKSCRGAMTRFILENQYTKISDIHAFSYEGFIFNSNLGEDLFPHFVREL
jgi:cytoplasmic iron level regulating protein YaaA (DUF328/UPF0246 family)